VIERLELQAWLRLLGTPGLGRAGARRLLAAFGSVEAAVAAPAGALQELVGKAPAGALSIAPSELAATVDAALAWQRDGKGHCSPRAIIPIGDPRYPKQLLDTADPPLLLYAQGALDLLQSDKAIAIVGSRNPTPQGEQNALDFAKSLGDAGWVVVSGLALGVDAAAHEGALASGQGTVAVVGTGLDRVYPKRHLDLARRISQTGVLLSEFPLGTPPLAPHFPLRNRVIAGLTKGTLVVEAALQSGSLITARLATEAGREVFAVPGSIHSPQSRGCHALIKQGAKLVETAQDVLDEFEFQPLARAQSQPPSQSPQVADTDPLLDAMGHELVSLDALVARTGWATQTINVRLLDLELSGRVVRRPGQLFQRIDAA
jgi:DNA processing protein